MEQIALGVGVVVTLIGGALEYRTLKSAVDTFRASHSRRASKIILTVEGTQYEVSLADLAEGAAQIELATKALEEARAKALGKTRASQLEAA